MFEITFKALKVILFVSNQKYLYITFYSFGFILKFTNLT